MRSLCPINSNAFPCACANLPETLCLRGISCVWPWWSPPKASFFPRHNMGHHSHKLNVIKCCKNHPFFCHVYKEIEVGGKFSLKDLRCLFFKWTSLNLSFLTGGKKFTFKLSRSASYLCWVVWQKKFCSLPYPLRCLIYPTIAQAASFQIWALLLTTAIVICIGISLWMLFKMTCLPFLFPLKNGPSQNAIILL